MSTLTIGLTLTLVLAGATTAAEPPNPQEVAERCIAAMDARATRCAEHVEAVADEVVDRIAALLAEGKIRAACRAARRGIEHIHEHGRSATGAIRDRAEKCVRRLRQLGAPDQARRVKDAAGAAVRAVRRSVGQAVARIVSALPVPEAAE